MGEYIFENYSWEDLNTGNVVLPNNKFIIDVTLHTGNNYFFSKIVKVIILRKIKNWSKTQVYHSHCNKPYLNGINTETKI